MEPAHQEGIFAVTSPGLEPVLLQEALALDPSARVRAGGVELQGERGLYRRANVWLRTATRVLVRAGRLRVGGVGELARGLKALQLGQFWPKGGPVRWSVAGQGPRRLPIGEALEAALGGKARQSPEGGEEEGPGLRVAFRWEDGALTVSVDSSGEPLYKRGYRQEVSRAPLRETLGAGLLGLMGYSGHGVACDPLCGSGTVAIEAALWARRLAPGLRRPFAFQQWPSFDAQGFERELAEALAQSLPRLAQPMRGSDWNAGALGTARRNARRAGVLGDVALERLDARALPGGGPPDLVVSNLPYGLRVGERGELFSLYKGLGASLRRAWPGVRSGFLVLEPDLLEEAFGAAATRKVPLTNGGLRCTFCIF